MSRITVYLIALMFAFTAMFAQTNAENKEKTKKAEVTKSSDKAHKCCANMSKEDCKKMTKKECAKMCKEEGKDMSAKECAKMCSEHGKKMSAKECAKMCKENDKKMSAKECAKMSKEEKAACMKECKAHGKSGKACLKECKAKAEKDTKNTETK